MCITGLSTFLSFGALKKLILLALSSARLLRYPDLQAKHMQVTILSKLVILTNSQNI